MSYQHCGGKNRAKKPCARPAGWGTNHAGYGRCRLHGGNTPNGKTNGNRLKEQAMTEQAVIAYALPRDVDPGQALLEEVHRSAGAVAYLTDLVGKLDEEHLTEDTIMGKQPVVWIRMRNAERVHLAKVARSAVDAGIAERQVRVVEAMGSQFVALIRTVVAQLGHDPDDPAVREVVSTALASLPTAA